MHADLHEHLNDRVHELNCVELLSDDLLGLRPEEWPRYLNRELLELRLERASRCICGRVLAALQQVVDQADLEVGDLLRAVLLLKELGHGHIKADLLRAERHCGQILPIGESAGEIGLALGEELLKDGLIEDEVADLREHLLQNVDRHAAMLATEIAFDQCLCSLQADFGEDLAEVVNPEHRLHVGGEVLSRVHHLRDEVLQSELIAARSDDVGGVRGSGL